MLKPPKMGKEKTAGLDGIFAQLARLLSTELNTNIRVKAVKAPERPTDDETFNLLVVDQRDTPIAFLLAGKPAGDSIVKRGLKRAEIARNVCGSDLGQAILTPLVTGVVDQYDYAVYPYCRSLPETGVAGIYYRLKFRRRLLEWIKQVTEKTSTLALSQDRSDLFGACLEYLESCELVSERLRRGASKAKGRMLNGEWIPRHVLTHTDLWFGNVLLAPQSRKDIGWPEIGPRFVVIDWPGAIEKGYAFFDLIRIAYSLRLSRHALRKEVTRHCDILACEATDSKSYLLAALGHIGIHMERFPVELYVSMSEQCFSYLDTAVGES